jgi:hypothetical protein
MDHKYGSFDERSDPKNFKLYSHFTILILLSLILQILQQLGVRSPSFYDSGGPLCGQHAAETDCSRHHFPHASLDILSLHCWVVAAPYASDTQDKGRTPSRAHGAAFGA